MRPARRSTTRPRTIIVDDASYTYLYNPQIVQGMSPDVEGYTARGDAAIRFRDVSLAQ